MILLKALKLLFMHPLDVLGHSLIKANGRPDYSTKTTDAYHQQNIFIGKNVQLAGYLNPGKGGKITIGDNVAIGHYTSIIAEQYDGIRDSRQDVRTLPRKYREITIGNGVWIGNSCIIMANVGEGSVIGAGAVVTKDIPSFVVAFGNPAEIKAHRAPSKTL
mgnify:FL=1